MVMTSAYSRQAVSKWAGNPETTPGPFTFRGCDLTAECLPAKEDVRVQLPATAPIPQAERQHAAESPKLSLLRAARRQPAILRGRGRQAMHLPCKQAHVGALPTDSTISSRETRPKHRDELHKLIQVGATPTPATTVFALNQRGAANLNYQAATIQ